MLLPDLPKKQNRKEASITPFVIKWFEKNYPYTSAIEVKVKGNRPLPHQTLALRQVDDGVFSYKLPDMGKRNPFDAFVLHGAKAFVVTCDGLNCEAVEPSGKKFNFKINKKLL